MISNRSPKTGSAVEFRLQDSLDQEPLLDLFLDAISKDFPHLPPSSTDFLTDLFNEIDLFFKHYIKSLPKAPESRGDYNSSIKSLSRKTVTFLKESGISSISHVLQILRVCENVLAENYISLETEYAGATSLVSDFFSSLAGAVADKWISFSESYYKKKLREANRNILLEKRKYYTIFNRMAEPSFIIDDQMCLVESNRAFNEFFGISDKMHLGKTCCEVLGDEVCTACALAQMLESKRSFTGVEVVLQVTGQVRTVLFSGTFLGDTNSEFSGGIISLQDITSSKEIEQALVESEEKFRSLIENVPDVTWRAGQEGNLVYISPNVAKVCGYLPEEMLSQHGSAVFDRIHPDDVERVRKNFNRFFAAHLFYYDSLGRLTGEDGLAGDINGVKNKYDVKYRFQKKDGSWIWLHDRATKIYKKDGTCYTDGILTDFSELKHAEDELDKHHLRLAELVDERTAELCETNARLKQEIKIRRQAERELLDITARLKLSNEELEQFAQVASHDLKEPLMMVMAFSERLQKKYAKQLDGRGKEYIVRLAKAAGQMKCLVDDLLAIARISSTDSEYEYIDLTNLVGEVVQNLEERIKRVGGIVEVAPLGSLDGDKTQLRQLFQNIIANALKYSTEYKEPVVAVKRSLGKSDFCEIIVEDNGIGFDPSLVDQIFKPFTRLHRRDEYEGTGMGLATCQKIVVRHGGEITAKSVPGGGSTFIVRLPVSPKKK